MSFAGRQDIIDLVARTSLDFDDFDMEDVGEIVDLLLKRYTPAEAASWLCLPDEKLETTPLAVLRDGGARRVLVAARRMVER
jgi:hypothetical protein